MSYSDKGEVTREYYRKQGEQRERERILKLIRDLQENLPGMTIYPHTLSLLIDRENEDACL